MLRNFNFLIDGVLAGSAMPGDWGDLREDLQHAIESQICAIVTLTERPLPKAAIKEFGMEYLHLPIEDYEPPRMDQIKKFVEFVDKIRNKNKGATLVHCRAGIGRTGTLLACYLVHEGKGHEEAIEEVRRKRPSSIETRQQEDVVRRYEKHLRKKK